MRSLNGILLCVMILLNVLSLTAQLPEWAWFKQAGGSGNDYCGGIVADIQGNQYVTGCFKDIAEFGNITLTSDAYEGIFVAKLDGNGNYLWAITSGGAGSCCGVGIALDAASNIYLTGSFQGTIVLGTTTLVSNGYYDVLSAKLDSDGNWLWVVNAGGTGGDWGNDVALDSSFNTYLTGEFSGTATFGSTTLVSNGYNEVFAAKLDSDGNWLWAVKAGGAGGDVGRGIAVDETANVYLTGSFWDTATFGSTTLSSNDTSFDIFVTKLDSNGSFLWAVSAGGEYDDIGYDIALDSTSNIYLTGLFSFTISFGPTILTSNGVYACDIFAAKLDGNGNWIWGVQAGGDADDRGFCIFVESDTNVYLTGSFRGVAPFGTTQLISSGDYNYEIFVAKLDVNGNWLGATQADYLTGHSDYLSVNGFCITMDASANVYVSGNFSGTATFGNTTLTSRGGSDIFVVKMGEGENHVPVELSSFSATLTAENYVHLSWVSQTETDMLGYRVYRNHTDNQAGSVMITPDLIGATNTSEPRSYDLIDNEVEIGQTYYYWLESVESCFSDFFGPISVNVIDSTPPSLPSVTKMMNPYPNPFKDLINIDVALKSGEVGEVIIYNIHGQIVRRFHANEGIHTITWNGKDIKGIACGNGIYFCKLSTTSFNQIKKMIIIK